jgi:hypothetical protein
MASATIDLERTSDRPSQGSIVIGQRLQRATQVSHRRSGACAPPPTDGALDRRYDHGQIAVMPAQCTQYRAEATSPTQNRDPVIRR